MFWLKPNRHANWISGEIWVEKMARHFLVGQKQTILHYHACMTCSNPPNKRMYQKQSCSSGKMMNFDGSNLSVCQQITGLLGCTKMAIWPPQNNPKNINLPFLCFGADKKTWGGFGTFPVLFAKGPKVSEPSLSPNLKLHLVHIWSYFE